MDERRMSAFRWLSAALLGVACGSAEDGGFANPGGAGSASSAAASSGGTAGGAPSTGGSSSISGGAPSTGGSSTSGGASSLAGASSLGGASPLGGASSNAGDAAGGDATSGQAGSDGTESSCGELSNGGQLLRESQRSGEPPAPQGGTIADGTYFLTSRNVYPPGLVGTAEHSATLRLTGGQYELARSNGVHEAGTFSTMTVLLRLSATCPEAATSTRPYTATGAALSLVTVSENLEEVFTKQ